MAQILEIEYDTLYFFSGITPTEMIAEKMQTEPKGEFVIVVSGNLDNDFVSEDRSIVEQVDFYIKNNILSDAIINNKIERSVLANVVFKSKALLDKLNFIVHAEVKKDILSWISKYHEEDILFIETAILYQSGIDQLVDAVWEIFAPKEIRIERVINRNKITKEEVVARISSQNLESTYKEHPNTYRISNDNINSILSQIEKLLKF